HSKLLPLSQSPSLKSFPTFLYPHVVSFPVGLIRILIFDLRGKEQEEADQRDVAKRVHKDLQKPSLLHSKFFPSLRGIEGKMSASVTNSAIFLDDSPQVIRKKMMAAYSGGGKTREEHQLHGANLDSDVAYQYLQ